MGNVDDIQYAERQRHARCHGGIEAADQDTRDHGVDQKIERKNHQSDTQPHPECAATFWSWLENFMPRFGGGPTDDRPVIRLTVQAVAERRPAYRRFPAASNAICCSGKSAAAPLRAARTLSGSDSGLLALLRNSMVMKTISLSPR